MEPQVVMDICQSIQRIYQHRDAVLGKLNRQTA
jgi:hypothetical protein